MKTATTNDEWSHPNEADARRWCERYGFEFRSWDGLFVYYRDPRSVGTPLEFGMESWVLG